jgi:hypothetical protein
MTKKKIETPTTLAEIRRMLKQADRVAYMKTPKAVRERHLAAFKKCSSSGDEMPGRALALNLIQFSFLFQLIENSLADASKAADFATAITDALSFKAVDMGQGFGLVVARPKPSMLVFDPTVPALGLISKPGEEEDIEDGHEDK